MSHWIISSGYCKVASMHPLLWQPMTGNPEIGKQWPGPSKWSPWEVSVSLDPWQVANVQRLSSPLPRSLGSWSIWPRFLHLLPLSPWWVPIFRRAFWPSRGRCRPHIWAASFQPLSKPKCKRWRIWYTTSAARALSGGVQFSKGANMRQHCRIMGFGWSKIWENDVLNKFLAMGFRSTSLTNPDGGPWWSLFVASPPAWQRTRLIHNNRICYKCTVVSYSII